MVDIATPVLSPVRIQTPGKDQLIKWAPVSSPVDLPFTGTSYGDVRDALKTAFGNFPIRLSSDVHLGVIAGMKAAAGRDVATYDVLYRALTKFTELELTDH